MDHSQLISVQLLPKAEYYPAGSTVQGQVVLNLHHPEVVHSITLKVTGEAKTHWTETETWETRNYGGDRCCCCQCHHSISCEMRRSGGRHGCCSCNRNGGFSSGCIHCHSHHYTKHSREVEYAAMQSCLDLETVVRQGANQVLTPGQAYTFPFSFKLPIKCPPSFEGASGNIRYYCLARANMSTQYVSSLATPLTILNAALSVNNKVIVEELSAESGCFKTTRVNAKITLPRGAFAPDDLIPVTFELVPTTKHKFEKIELKLRRYAVYTGTRASNGKSHSRSNEETVMKWKGDIHGIDKTSEKIERALTALPSEITVDNCAIIQTHYFMKVKLHTSKGACGGCVMRCRIPVVLGAAALSRPEAATLHKPSSLPVIAPTS
ncbi:Protein ARRD-5, partial [Aphelenchoides avenae]